MPYVSGRSREFYHTISAIGLDPHTNGDSAPVASRESDRFQISFFSGSIPNLSLPGGWEVLKILYNYFILPCSNNKQIGVTMSNVLPLLLLSCALCVAFVNLGTVGIILFVFPPPPNSHIVDSFDSPHHSVTVLYLYYTPENFKNC